MSKADFWYLIEETRTSCGEDQKTYLRHLGEWLKALGPDYAQDFHDILHVYVELADKLGLWSAATLMGRSSEHDFENFRSWLISHGQDVYLAALKNPDTLADIDPGDGNWFEDLTYAGATVLFDLTGKNAYKETDLRAYETLLEELKADIEYGEGIDYPFEENEMPEFFPRLFPKYRDTVIKIVRAEGRIWNPTHWRVEMRRKDGPPSKPEQKTIE